jgi:iron only hydrogenase large subunit-like protein
MAQFFHAHRVVSDKIRGHQTSMRHCPSQAIRVRGGKAIISEDTCVDCGTCLSVCSSKAIEAVSDPISDILRFKYKVVIPSSVLYSQFEPSIHPYVIHMALKRIGFDAVVDTGVYCANLARAYVKYMEQHRRRLPFISSDCPAMLRLIQVRYPDLVELVMPLDVPRELTAREIKRELSLKLGLKPEEIGVAYLSPCPAKVVSIKQPAEKARSWLDSAIAIKDVYPLLVPHVSALKDKFDESQVPKDFVFSAGWSILGGVTRAVNMANWLAVSGPDHVMKIFDDIENSRLSNIDFVEAMTCIMGCIGGSFNVENPYVARTNSIKQSQRYESRVSLDDGDVAMKLEQGYFALENQVLPRPSKYFDTDLQTSLKRMKESERVYQKLPQIDCGCCGAPTCKVFADDFALGEARLTDCIYLSPLGGQDR